MSLKEDVELASTNEREMEYELEKMEGDGNSAWLKELCHVIYDKNEMQGENKEHQSRKMRACQKFTVVEQRSDLLD